MNSPDPDLQTLIDAVRSGTKYRSIDIDLVRQVSAQELAKGRKFKDAVKAVRNKLHQVGGAYQEEGIDYPRWAGELAGLPADLHHPAVLDFCRRMMASHASTRERLPLIDRFYQQTLASIAPLHSVLDVACGLNFLTIPWLPRAADFVYSGCDIYTDLVEFGCLFLQHFQVRGQIFQCNLARSVPGQPAQLALVLKTIPCLEQLDKSTGPRLLAGLQASSLLVSFPARSLGGCSKGMVENYEAHFYELIAGAGWEVERFEFATEIAYLLKK